MFKARFTIVSVISIFMVTALALPGAATARHHKKPKKSCVTTGCFWQVATSQGVGGILVTGQHKVSAFHTFLKFVCTDGPQSNATAVKPTSIDAQGQFSESYLVGSSTISFSGKITGKTASGTLSLTSGAPQNCSGTATWTAKVHQQL